MTTEHWIALGLILGSTALFIWIALTAPEGFEDEHGFHFGREDDQ